MNKKQLLVLSVLLFSIAIVYQSCVRDNMNLDKVATEFQWNPNYVAPIAKGSLGIRDILQDYDTEELFEQDATGFLYMRYDKRVYFHTCTFLLLK